MEPGSFELGRRIARWAGGTAVAGSSEQPFLLLPQERVSFRPSPLLLGAEKVSQLGRQGTFAEVGLLEECVDPRREGAFLIC